MLTIKDKEGPTYNFLQRKNKSRSLSIAIADIFLPFFAEGFVLLWKKGEDFIAVGDRIVNPTDPRLQLIKETNGNTLVISLAEEEDAGEYVCQVSTYKPIEIKHSVQIRGKCPEKLRRS